MEDDLLQKVLSRVEYAESGCWLWTGGKSNGYGHVKAQDGKARGVHRIVYELMVRPIPTGLQLDHLCRNRACCNPAHLEVVTQRMNVLRGEAPAASQAAQTHCKRGHEFTPANTYWQPRTNRRVCRTCYVERYQRIRTSKKPYKQQLQL